MRALVGVLALTAAALACSRDSSGRAPAERGTSDTESTVQSGRESLTEQLMCGRSRRPPIIQPESLGPIGPVLSLTELRRLCPEARDTIGLSGGWEGVAFEAFGSVISVPADFDGALRGVTVVGGSLKTSDGLGAGSTIAELERHSRVDKVFLCGSEPAGVSLASRRGLVFLFSLCTLDGETAPAPLDSSATVVGVSIGGWGL